MPDHAESTWQQLADRLERLLQPPERRATDTEARCILDQLRVRFDALEARNRDLASALGEQECRLRQQQEELNNRDRLHDHFLALLSRELRNPVGAIRMVIELFKLHESGLDADCRGGLRILDRQLVQLGRLLDDLLDMARINNGRIVLQKVPLGLAEVVEHTVQSLRPQLEARSQSLDLSLPDTPLTLDADPVRLTQALGNLLHNAAKFSDSGARVQLQAYPEHDQAVIIIRDAGVGIDPAALAHLFEPFGTRDHHHGGLGLGLALARHLIRLHGGHLQGDSQGPGRGSVFTVRLPATRREPSPGPAPPALTADSDGDSHRILVVDDNPDAAEGLERLLVGLGHRVRTALDGASALRLAAEFQPEVVFLDIGMPGMNGYQVARRLRAETPGRIPRLIALTGYGGERDRQQARQVGFDEHLVKPADLPTLRTVLAPRHRR